MAAALGFICAHFIFSLRKIVLHHPSSNAEAKLSPNTAHKKNSNTKNTKNTRWLVLSPKQKGELLHRIFSPTWTPWESLP